MALDKQKILNELGNVMSQLQSADCGCMGKLFSNPNQYGQAPTGTPSSTCGGFRRGCCHGHSCSPYNNGTPSGDEAHSMPHSMSCSTNVNRHCMGQCNPPKLYSDTYNYLNDKLMQPVVQEVYNDLKSITPDNTIMNNPLANQMGLTHGNISNTNNPMAQNNGTISAGNTLGMNGASNMNSMTMVQSPPQENMGGMGPQIVNMIMGSGANEKRFKNDQIIPDAFQTASQNGVASPTAPPNSNLNQVIGNSHGQCESNIDKHQFNKIASNMSSCNKNYVTQSNACPEGYVQSPTMTLQGNTEQNNVPLGNMPLRNAYKAAPQMISQKSYGQHTQGMKKFNEIFPGVMQGSDLGFDPMAIAIQMNPANQKKVAMDTMNKFLNNTPLNRVMGQTNTNQPQMSRNAQPQQFQNISYGDQLQCQEIDPAGKIVYQEMLPGQQSMNGSAGTTQQQHQIYSTTVGAPTELQQQMYHQPSNNLPHQNRTIVPPNNGTMNSQLTPPGNDITRDTNSPIQPTQANSQIATLSQNVVKDPILPVDTSHSLNVDPIKPQKQYYEYNTLGQPVQMLPARIYCPPQSELPQTLSPQSIPTKLRNDPMKYSNVKSTVSKTSLMANRPTLSAPSRSQLQNIYNQYKGSQSFTQQNLQSAVQGGTYSEGKLNVNRPNVNAILPVEKVGGDTLANNQVHGDNTTNKVELAMGQIGDVPMSHKPPGDRHLVKPTSIPTKNAKCRNGLQDMVYTSYPSSAAWSFHGRQEYRPFTTGYRFTK